MNTPNARHGLRVEAPTEQRNESTVDLDLLPTPALLGLINDEDKKVAPAVERALPELATAVDIAVNTLRRGGNVHYFGAGTSGRLATLDAAELAPTFNLEAGRVVAHHAGGTGALDAAVEDVEDDLESGRAAAGSLSAADCAVGLTASGRTPYVAGALGRAHELGAATVLVSANPHADIAALADVHVCVDTGPEVLTGSTRMKAGTAQKLVLNALSTAAMVRLGRTYSNLMSSVVPKNAKLSGRMVTILVEATGCDPQTCSQVLAESHNNLQLALVQLLAGVDGDQAQGALRDADGVVRVAVSLLTRGRQDGA
ncbi:MAG: N-acetylmuramic acid 6-phosphate etherase [Nocardioidaceae bacterium]